MNLNTKQPMKHFATRAIQLEGKTFNAGDIVTEVYMNSPMAQKFTRAEGEAAPAPVAEELTTKSIVTEPETEKEEETDEDAEELPEPIVSGGETEVKEETKEEQKEEVKTPTPVAPAQPRARRNAAK